MSFGVLAPHLILIGTEQLYRQPCKAPRVPWYANLLVSESKKSEDIIVGDKKMTIPEYAIVGGKTDE